MCREILYQVDLLLSERSYLLAEDGYDPNQFIILEQWHSDLGSSATKFHGFDNGWVALCISFRRCKIDVNRLLGSNYFAKRSISMRMKRAAPLLHSDK